MHLVLDGKADLGVTQLSEVIQANRAALVGPFPPEFDLATTYSLWLRSDAPPAAKEFAKLITSPAERAKLAPDLREIGRCRRVTLGRSARDNFQ